MTASFCSNCGAKVFPGASFCAACGTAVVAPADSAAPPSPQEPQAAQQPAASPAPMAQHPPAQPDHPAPPPYDQPRTVPQPGGYPGQQPPYAGHAVPSPPRTAAFPAQPQYGGQQPQTEQPWAAGAPAAAPWGAASAPGTYQQPAVPRRNLLDALLAGDWGGAARAAGIAVGVMVALSLVGMLLISQGTIGFRETLALVFAGACLAVGGDAYAEADGETFAASTSFGVLPLTITLVGLAVLASLYARQLRRAPVSATDALLQGVRTALVFTLFFLPLSLLTRFETEPFEVVAGLSGRIGVGVVSTMFGALLFAVAALGLAWLLSPASALSGRVAGVRDAMRAPLLGAVAVFSVGLLAVLGVLLYGLVEQDEKLAQLGAVVLVAGNGSLLTVLLSAGVPLGMEGSASNGPLGGISPTADQSVDLFTFTDMSAWFWLGPVVLLAAMVLVAAALAVRQNTIEDARREGFRFAGALAFCAFVATLLLRIGAESEAGELATEAGGSVMFNPLVAAVVLGLWGVVTGLLAPVVAAKMPSGFVLAVRRRFGAADAPSA